MRIFLCVLALSLLSVASYGQAVPATKEADAPFKKANVVLVATSDSSLVALKRMAAILVGQGFIIKKLDPEFLTLLTEPKALPIGFSPVLSIQVRAVSGMLRVTGETLTNFGQLGDSRSKSQFFGVETSVLKGSFRVIEKAAKAYPGAAVRYSLE